LGGFAVDEPAAGGALLVALPVDAGGGLAGEDAGAAPEPVGVSFFSPAAAGVFSPSEGGLSLFE